jgi:enoyl-CoA hydratase/carnithine racemase
VRPEGIATVTMSGATELNLLDTTLINETTSVLTELAGRRDVRVLVLRGAGDRAFLAGADITEMASLRRETAEGFIGRLAGLCEAVRSFPTPVLARLQGWCLGGGLEVALACDVRIAGGDAHFGMPEVAVGIPSVIHAALLPRMIGAGRAAWLVLTGQPIDAATAASWGMVDQLCGPGGLEETVDALAGRLTQLGPAVLRQQKRLLRSWQDTPLDAAINSSIAEFGRAFDTGEPQEFMTRFLNRGAGS